LGRFLKKLVMKRIALVGASSVGKTTVYELLKSKLPEYDFINESTRTVGKYGFPINEDGTSETQLAISSFHLEALLTPKDVILDRCYLDLLVYSGNMENLSSSAYTYILDTWLRVLDQYTHFIYFPIEFASVDDGVRSVNEDWRTKIDAEFKHHLQAIKGLGGDYLTVTGSPNQRVEQILNYIK
jgi:GTPase SAR1 family protein